VRGGVEVARSVLRTETQVRILARHPIRCRSESLPSRVRKLIGNRCYPTSNSQNPKLSSKARLCFNFSARLHTFWSGPALRHPTSALPRHPCLGPRQNLNDYLLLILGLLPCLTESRLKQSGSHNVQLGCRFVRERAIGGIRTPTACLEGISL
jgi:hypothetical protein